jgi:hypothetical protein
MMTAASISPRKSRSGAKVNRVIDSSDPRPVRWTPPANIDASIAVSSRAASVPSSATVVRSLMP